MAYTNLRPRRVPNPFQNANPASVRQPNPGETD